MGWDGQWVKPQILIPEGISKLMLQGESLCVGSLVKRYGAGGSWDAFCQLQQIVLYAHCLAVLRRKTWKRRISGEMQ